MALAALIWGTSFVAQSVGADYIGSFTFNGIRMMLGGIVLIPVAAVSSAVSGRGKEADSCGPLKNRKLLIAGIICGVVMCVASNFQQFGIANGTSAGKSGFITALYVVLVPVVSVFLKKRPPITVWCGMVLAVVGLYLLCVTGNDGICLGDLLTLICAAAFTLHIMLIDKFSPSMNGVWLSCIQFLVGGIVSCVFMFAFEHPSISSIMSAAIPIAYSGIMSCGVAYTLQILGQKNTEPTVASIILSMESVFAALSGWIILGQGLGGREILGCVLMFAAIVLAQIPREALSFKRNLTKQ